MFAILWKTLKCFWGWKIWLNLFFKLKSGPANWHIPKRWRFVSSLKADSKRCSSLRWMAVSASRWRCSQRAYSSLLKIWHKHTKGYIQTYTQLKNQYFFICRGAGGTEQWHSCCNSCMAGGETLTRCFITWLCWQAVHKQEYIEPSLWKHKLAAWERGTDCSLVTKHVPPGRAGPCSHLCRTTSTVCPEPTDTLNLSLTFFAMQSVRRPSAAYRFRKFCVRQKSFFCRFPFELPY